MMKLIKRNGDNWLIIRTDYFIIILWSMAFTIGATTALERQEWDIAIGMTLPVLIGWLYVIARTKARHKTIPLWVKWLLNL